MGTCRALERLGRDLETKKDLEAHQAIQATNPGPQPTVATLEKIRHTEPRVQFKLEQPDQRGIAITLNDHTDAMLVEAETN